MTKLVVIGNGMVGHHLVSQFVDSEVSVTVIGEETRPAYDRVHLSELFSGKTPDDIALVTLDEYENQGVEFIAGDAASAINPEDRIVTTASGKTLGYDKLVIATGSVPFVPPIPGGDHEACFVYRTIDDLDLIQRYAAKSQRGVVIGGGLLGLECANALMNLGLETHVVEFAPGLMGVQLDADGSEHLKSHIEDLGVQVHVSKATQSITETDSGLTLAFADGSSLETDMVVFSAGIRPNDALARACGMEVGERGGIVTNERCETSLQDVYAVGECALYDGKIFGLVAPGYRMAEAAASQILKGEGEFTGADMSTKLKLLGVDVGSIGDAHGRTENSLSYSFYDPINKIYKRLNVTADGQHVVGAVLVGDCSSYDTILQYFLNQMKLPAAPEGLLVEGGAPELDPGELPATATICSCHNVSRGSIVDAIDGGCCDLGSVKAETKASTGCGGCAALLKKVVDTELEARGVVVDKSICEHFPYTRQELFHICQVNQVKTFADLIASHGKGKGCDICKPTAASIFASLWNEHVLDKPHVGLQDTNDRFMANMQKNGTYSVVPRIPGGEITPDKLLALGSVAKKFDLYTKITGGQRIDLFGAELHELPLIWRELVDAGFETGHAYGKSLRTVKSCVGSTWCRYGVQDSVGMALLLENRYKGLRSPHKLKLAVSGCTRECAEAQSKDIGVIATENGWNLYVCGNGGMRPRHADLFATDLDDVTLVKYIDRVLSFYVRTADRLQRTSVWLESLEGGLGYLREVVIEDSLGICSELEAQMESVVGTYQCEWNTTLNDPEKLKQFRQFVNDDKSDPDVVFIRERGQRRPATKEEVIATDSEGAGATKVQVEEAQL